MAEGKTPLLSNRLFDGLKWTAQIGLPSVATLYFALAAIWGLPNAEQVVGSITAVDAFLGVLLGISTKSYNTSDAKYDGAIELDETADKKVFSLVYDGNPEEMVPGQDVVFKVQAKS